MLKGLNLFCFISILQSHSLSSYAYTIMLDPGHGGYDKGAVYGQAQESKIVLDITVELKKWLEQNGFSVFMTRENDNFVSLQKRVDLSQKSNADLFVSLHANASQDKRARGIEFFLQTPQINNLQFGNPHLINQPSSTVPPGTVPGGTVTQRQVTSVSFEARASGSSGSGSETGDESGIISGSGAGKATEVATISETEKPLLSKKNDRKKIISELTENIKIKRSLNLTAQLKKELPGVIKQAPFFVLTKTEVPSVLIEVGFLSHPKDNRRLLSKTYQEEVAQKIFSSLQRFSAKSENSVNYLDEKVEIPK